MRRVAKIARQAQSSIRGDASFTQNDFINSTRMNTNIQTKAILGQNGTVGAAILNQSPVTIDRIRLKVEYIDANGQLREFTHSVKEALAAGQQTAESIGLRGIADQNELTQRVRITILAAQVANQ